MQKERKRRFGVNAIISRYSLANLFYKFRPLVNFVNASHTQKNLRLQYLMADRCVYARFRSASDERTWTWCFRKICPFTFCLNAAIARNVTLFPVRKTTRVCIFYNHRGRHSKFFAVKTCGLLWIQNTVTSAFRCEWFWSALRSLGERGRRPVHCVAEAARLSKMFFCTLCTELWAVDHCQRDLEWTRCRPLRGCFSF